MGVALWIAFLACMAIGMPLAFVMGGSGLIALLVEGKLSLLSVPQRFFNGINSFPLMAVPFFILAADLMSAGGITSYILRFANSLVGHIRGGLGHVNVLTNMVFAGISGSALADAAGPGAILMRMMQRAGYDPYYSAAFSGATATLGPIIPPSIIAIIYAMCDSRVTVAGLFMAGVVPGILLGGALAVTNHIISVRHGYKFTSKKASWAFRLRSFWKALPALMVPGIIVRRHPGRDLYGDRIGGRGGLLCPLCGSVHYPEVEFPAHHEGAPSERPRLLGGPAHRRHGFPLLLAPDDPADSPDGCPGHRQGDDQPHGCHVARGRFRPHLRHSH